MNKIFSMIKNGLQLLPLFLIILCSNLNAQAITSISSPGATTSGSAGSWKLDWITSTTTSSIYQRIDLTLTGYAGQKLIFDASVNSSDWQVQFGSAGSGAWKTFCQEKGGLGANETVYIRNASTTPGTYKNTIYIGISSSGCSGYTPAVTMNVEVTVTSSGVYTWIGTSGTDSLYTTSTNWSPTRSTVSSTDYLCVNLGSAVVPVSTTIDISNVTETIGQFKIYENNTVDFKCTTNNANWTVGNGSASGGKDFILSPNAVMRKTGGATLNITIPANDSFVGSGVLGTVAGTLNFNGAGKHIQSGNISTFGGTLSYKPTVANTLQLTGFSQSISGTNGTLYIDSMMNVTVGDATATSSSKTTLTLNRKMELWSTLKLLGNSILVSNTPASSSSADFHSWNPFLQLKAPVSVGAKYRGQLDVFPTTASINGGCLFEIAGTNVRAYRMFGIPLKNGVNLSQFADNIDITGNYSGSNKDSFSTTCTYCVSSAFAWYESSQSWVAYNSGNSANKVDHGTGIMMFFRGTKTNGLGSPTTAANNSIIDFKGELFTGSKTINLDYNSSGTTAGLRGYNLVANPYPCAIDFHKVVKPSGFKQKFQVYDGRAKTYNIWDSTISGNLSRSGSNKFTASSQNNSRIIDAGASFFAIASGTGESIEFVESSKVPTLKSSIDHFKSTENSLKCSEIRIGIHFMNDSIPENDNSLIQMDMNYEGIKAENDEFDAPKLFGGFLGIGPVSTDGVWMSIDRRPANTEKTYSVPLRVKTPENNQYKITMEACESNSMRYNVVLVDKLLSKVIPFKNGVNYQFVKTSLDNLIEDRFELIYTSNQEVTTSVTDMNKNVVSVYPNPSNNGEFNVVSMSGNKISKIQLFSIDGKLAKTFDSDSLVEYKKIKIETKGTYILRIIGTNAVSSQIIMFN